MTPKPTLTLMAVALAALSLSGPAAGAPCAAFTDVDDSSAFCANVEWLKNRKVTLGCTSSTLYCPTDVVTRLSMAAFMNRLGVALTPVDLPQVTAASAARTLAAAPVICITAPYVVEDFPRRAYANATANLSIPTANVDVAASVVVSLNNGATWTPLVGAFQYASLYTGATPGNHYSLAPFGIADLNVGQTVRFGVQLARFDAGSGDVSASCQTSVQIANRNGTVSPLDPAVAASGARRGGL